MSLEIYKADFSNRYEITHAISIQMIWNYNDIGKFSLVIPSDDYNINAIEVNGIVYDTETGETFIIEQVKYDSPNNRITAYGYSSNWMLNKRVITNHTEISDANPVESIVKSLVDDNLRGLPRISTAPLSGLTDTITIEDEEEIDPFSKPLMDKCVSLLDMAELGHRLVWNPETNQFKFKIYKGNDLTSGIHAVVFSEEQGTASNLTITDDNSSFKNVCYCSIKYRNDSEDVIEYGTATAGNRYEYFLNNTQNQTNDETDAQFVARVKGQCAAELARRLRRTTFVVSIDAEDLGSAFNLGDKVSVVSVKYGVTFNARITGVKYTLDARGTTTSLILGEPELTALKELQLNG